MRTPVDEDNLEKFLLELSMYQDQLLQNYRHIFIASQTILISIAMLLLVSGEKSIFVFLFYLILFCIGLILITLWKAITKSRGLDVSYCHMQLLRLERKKDKPLKENEERRPFDSFKEWQQCTEEAKMDKLNNYDKHLLDSQTRKDIEKLPDKFLILWIFGIVLYVISMII